MVGSCSTRGCHVRNVKETRRKEIVIKASDFFNYLSHIECCRIEESCLMVVHTLHTDIFFQVYEHYNQVKVRKKKEHV